MAEPYQRCPENAVAHAVAVLVGTVCKAGRLGYKEAEKGIVAVRGSGGDGYVNSPQCY